MDTRTGEIFTLEEVKKKIVDDPTIAKWMKEIPIEFEEKLRGMNRKERRAWYKQNKMKFRPLKEGSV